MELNRPRAWKFSDVVGELSASRCPDADANDKPSISCANASFYEPSEHCAFPDDTNAITPTGNDR